MILHVVGNLNILCFREDYLQIQIIWLFYRMIMMMIGMLITLYIMMITMINHNKPND